MLGKFALALTILPLLMTPAFAQSPDFISNVTKEYHDNGCLSMHSQITSFVPLTPVILQVFGPTDNLIEIRQIELNEDKTFDVHFATMGTAWEKEGPYLLKIVYGKQDYQQQFNLESIAMTTHPMDEKFGLDENDYYFKTLTPTTNGVLGESGDSISFDLSKSSNPCIKGDSYLYSMEFHNPSLYTENEDTSRQHEFVVMVNDEKVSYDMTPDHATAINTIYFDVPYGDATVEVTATKVVPEFGVMMIVILAVAIVSIIALTKSSFVSQNLLKPF